MEHVPNSRTGLILGESPRNLSDITGVLDNLDREIVEISLQKIARPEIMVRISL